MIKNTNITSSIINNILINNKSGNFLLRDSNISFVPGEYNAIISQHIIINVTADDLFIGEDTSTNAKFLQEQLNIKNLNDKILLRFIPNRNPATSTVSIGNTSLTNNFVNVQLGANNNFEQDLFINVGVIGVTGVNVGGEGLIIVETTNITEGSESINFNIIQQGAISNP